MKNVIIFSLFFFLAAKVNAGSFTTIFGSEGAASVGNSKARSLSYSLQYLTISGFTGYVTKQLFETGFFEPLGFIPDSYKSLSPLAYDEGVTKALSRKQKLIFKSKEEVFSDYYKLRSKLFYLFVISILLCVVYYLYDK